MEAAFAPLSVEREAFGGRPAVKKELWQKAKQIVLRAEELRPEDREAYLDHACGDDQELRETVDALLKAAADSGRLADFLEDPPVSLLTECPVPGRIGAYRPLHEIGRGGAGVVYLAEHTAENFKQKVAIKILSRQPDAGWAERFHSERQILANLVHPNICRLYSAGSLPDGRPYFAMEHIEGTPITRYCAEKNLGFAARLKIFRQVCEAVQFAHQNLVIHRDLTPGNILVTESGEPKLLDFGIAKLQESDEDSSGTQLPDEERLLTLRYASPEQVHGTATTTTTDVYSLGVILYQLLTGRLPYRYEKGKALEPEQIITEQEVPAPSSLAGAAADDEEHLIGTGDQLRGDLDAIVLMALRKEPRQRYQSVVAFSEDIERHLQHRPIRAQKATLLYRSRKFVCRNRLGAATALLVLLLVCGSFLVLTFERRRAVEERDKSQEIAAFLKKIFKSADAFMGDPEAVTAKELLDRAAQRLERGELTAQPGVRSDLQQTMADSYLNLGIFEPAEQLARNAMELREELHGPDHQDVAESQRTLALVVADNGDFESAKKLLDASLRTRRQRLGNMHPDVADTLSSLGFVEFSRAHYEAAERFQKEALEIRRAVYGEFHEDIAQSLNFLGLTLRELQRTSEAESRFLESLKICRAVLGDDHPQVAVRLHNLGLVYRVQERFKEAEKHHREALEILEQSLGPKHFAVATTINMMALFLEKHGRYEEALPLQLRALAIRQELFGTDHYSTAVSINNLGAIYFKMGRLSESEEALREAVRIRRAVLRPNHPSLGNSLVTLGTTLLGQGRFEEARSVFEQGIAIHESENHRRLPRSLREYAKLFLAMGDDAKAQEIEGRATLLEEAG